MKYNISISGVDTICVGNGFFGDDFNSIEELKNIIRNNTKNVCIYKMTFYSADTMLKIKSSRDKDAAAKKNINLFALANILKKDRLYGYTIYYNRRHWIDEIGEFAFIVETPNGDMIRMYNAKLSTILRNNLGLDF